MKNSLNLSMAYVRHILSMAEGLGISRAAMLSSCGLTLSETEPLDAYISARQIGQLTRYLLQTSGRQDLGIAYGLSVRPPLHGSVGYALLSCPTLIDAFRVGNQYLALRLKGFSVVHEKTDQEVILRLSESFNFGAERHIYFEAMLVMCCQFLKFLIGQQFEDLKVDVDWPQPAYFDTYKARLSQWSFEQDYNQIRFPRFYLTLPLIMADPIAFKIAIAQVEKEAMVRMMSSSREIIPRVRAILLPSDAGYPQMCQVAEALCLTERTLRRKLRDAGSSYQSLLDEARKRRAIQLIRAKKLSLQEIMAVLGYSDPATFTRAFKRWTGKRPTDLR